MAQWRGQVTSRAVEKRGGLRMRIWIVARFGIIDGGQLQPETITMRLPYPAAELAGLSYEEKWEKILNEGAGGTPALRDIGEWFLSDWNDGAAIRQLPVNHEFGPL